MDLYSCKNNNKNGLFCRRVCRPASAVFQIICGEERGCGVELAHTAELHGDEQLSPMLQERSCTSVPELTIMLQ